MNTNHESNHDCIETNVLLTRIIDGDLPQDRQERLERHLAECRDCRDLVEQAESADMAMAAIAESGRYMPDALQDRVLARLDPSTGGRRGNRLSVIALVAVLIFSITASTWLMSPGVRGMNNPFSGYDRRLHGQSGYSRFLVAAESHEVVGETGFDVAHERYVPDVLPQEDWVYSARGFLSWTTNVEELIQVGNSFESFVNVEAPEDVRLIGELSLSLRASNILSVKTTYMVEHETTPIEGFRPTDQMMALTLMGSLFGQLPEPVGPPEP